MVDRWYPLVVSQAVNIDGFTITLTTDVPCHLFLFYTFKKPWVHPVSVNQRGLTLPWWAYWCYVSWIIVEQDEPGDTTVHTFQITGLVTCNRIWFRFHGTIAGNSSPSDSPIFEKHFVKPLLPSYIDWPPRDPWVEIPTSRWYAQCYEFPIDGTPTEFEMWFISNAPATNDVTFYLEECFYEPIPDVWQPYTDQPGHILDEVTIPKGEFVPTDLTPYSKIIPFPNPPAQSAGTGIAITMYHNYPTSPKVWPLKNQDLPNDKFRSYRYPSPGTHRPWVGNIPLNIPWACKVTFTP